jgi:D-threo-aldose 1-dehydrogenase
MKTNVDLQVRPFGRTDLRVTPLCVGTAPLGDILEAFSFTVPEDRALATLRAVFASPITFVDTSANYGDGTAERRIGVVLRELGGLPPGRVLATKADRDMTTGDFSGAQMKRSVEESLQRLGLDRLQFVYIHDPEHTTFENITSRGGALDVLQDLSGRVSSATSASRVGRSTCWSATWRRAPSPPWRRTTATRC